MLIAETVGIPCLPAASIAGARAVGDSGLLRMMSAPCWIAELNCCTCSATACCDDAVVTIRFLSTSGLRLRNFWISRSAYAFHEFDGADQTIATLYGGLPFGFQFDQALAMIGWFQPV